VGAAKSSAATARLWCPAFALDALAERAPGPGELAIEVLAIG
jgi:hypothetical protein